MATRSTRTPEEHVRRAEPVLGSIIVQVAREDDGARMPQV
jgi:hypothetical protein